MPSSLRTGAPPDFVKIDVEGMELPILHGAEQLPRTHQPALYIELHGATLAEKRANAEQVVAVLDDVGYREMAHVETGTQVTIDALPPEGHLYCPGRRPVSATMSQRTTAPPQRRDPQRRDPQRRDPQRRDPQRQDPQRRDPPTA